MLRSAKNDRKRKRSRSGSMTGSQKWQPGFNDSVVGSAGAKTVGFKNVDDDKRPNGHAKNLSKEYKLVPNAEPKTDMVSDKRISVKGA